MHNFAKKFAAELVGSFGVVFIAAGSICADQYLSASGQGHIGILGIAAAYGLAYAVMVSALAHVSGGHFNPAVTVGTWVTRHIGTLQAISYLIAQLVGSICATYLLVALMPEGGWRTRALGSITPDLSPDITRGQGMLIEATLTFFVVLVIFSTAIDTKRALQKFSGLISGLSLSIAVLVAAPFTGGSMNPARSFGPAMVTHHWENHGVYWVGPLLGGIIGCVLYDRLFFSTQPAAIPASSRPSDAESHEIADRRH